MASMYETIMELPLFKGASHNQISFFLENTHVEFLNFQKGEEVIKDGEPRKQMMFLIKGEVSVSFPLASGNMVIESIVPAGEVLLGALLFGMITTSTASVVAVSDCSVLAFSKEQYMHLLSSDNIFLLNYLNYLSRKAQRPMQTFMNMRHGGAAHLLAFYTSVLSPLSSREVIFHLKPGVLTSLSSQDDATIFGIFDSLKERGLIDYNDERVEILKPREFIEELIDE